MVVVTFFLGTVFTYAQSSPRTATQEKAKTTAIKQEAKPAAAHVKSYDPKPAAEKKARRGKHSASKLQSDAGKPVKTSQPAQKRR